MSLPVAYQIEQFLWSVGLGAALALVCARRRAARSACAQVEKSPVSGSDT